MEEADEKQIEDARAIYEKLRKWRNDEEGRCTVKTSIVFLHAPFRYVNVPLLVIGQNPGGPNDEDNGEEDIFDAKDNFLFSSPHRYALTAYAVFAKANRLNHLKYAQSTDMNFFRNLNRAAAKKASVCALRRLIKILDPELTLINGKIAARSYLRAFRDGLPLPPTGFGQVTGDPKIFVFPHFSRRKEATLQQWRDVIAQLSTFLPEATERELGLRRDA